MSVRVIFALKQLGLVCCIFWVDMGILLCEPGCFVSCTCGCGLSCLDWKDCFVVFSLLFALFLSGLMPFVIMIKTKQKTFGGKGKLPVSIKMIHCWQTDFNGGHIVSVSRGVSPVTTGVNVTPKHLLFFPQTKNTNTASKIEITYE